MQPLADLLVGVAIREQAEHFALALCERGDPLREVAADEESGEHRVDVGLACDHELDAAHEVGERRLLEDEPACTDVERLGEERSVAEGRVEDDEVCGDTVAARVATSMPESFGICMSTTATCGFVASISASTRWPSAARPTTSKPLRTRMSAIAASIAGWSSATTMVGAAVMLCGMETPEPLNALLATLLSLPDERRAAVERALVPLARAAALGDLAADVAHDVANPLFGSIGLVDLLLEDAAPGSEDAARLRLVHEAAFEMKATLQALLDFARIADDDTGDASLDEAVRSALRLLRHGESRAVVVEERYPAEPVRVPCPAGPLVQAVLQLLLAARGLSGLAVEVTGGALRLSPAPAESVGTLVAGRIVADHGGRVERTADALTLSWS